MFLFYSKNSQLIQTKREVYGGKWMDDLLWYELESLIWTWTETEKTIYYYHKDHQWSVIWLSNLSGDIVVDYYYDDYGQPYTLVWTGDFLILWAIDPEYGNSRLYTWREYDEEIGLYYYRNRYYDGATGRFISRDPIGYADNLNLYSYVGWNPINYTDPLGLEMRSMWAFGHIMKWTVIGAKDIAVWVYQMARHPVKNVWVPSIEGWRLIGTEGYKLFSSDTIKWVKIATQEYIETTSPWQIYEDIWKMTINILSMGKVGKRGIGLKIKNIKAKSLGKLNWNPIFWNVYKLPKLRTKKSKTPSNNTRSVFGNSINLHHYRQLKHWPFIELFDWYHNFFTKVLHPRGKKPSLVDRPEFNNWRTQYNRYEAKHWYNNRPYLFHWENGFMFTSLLVNFKDNL